MADNAFRKSMAAAAALAGAGAISLASVAALPDDEVVIAAPRTVSVDVQSVAFAEYAEILAAGATAALQQSADGLLVKVPELWWTVHANWPDADLTHWNYALVTDMVLAPVAPLVIGPFNDAVAEVLAQQFPAFEAEIRQLPELVEYTAVRVAGPLLSAIGGAGMAHSGIFYSMTTGQLEPFFEAVAKAPFHVVDGFLNGGYGDLGPVLPGREGSYIPAPGLLTPWGEEPAPRDIKTPEDLQSAPSVAPKTSRANLAHAVAEEQGTDDAASPVKVEVPSKRRGLTSATERPDIDKASGLRAGIRQGAKDFRKSVHQGVKKLSGGAKRSGSAAPRPEKPGTGDSATD
ncbi:hypothetical protein ABQF34_04290 [Mycolicibacterium boenickei]